MSGDIPEIHWDNQDDLCDCIFQRIGWWTNPYLGKTMETRICCFYKRIVELLPELSEFIREIDSFDNYVKQEQGPIDPTYHFEQTVRPWDAEFEMPRAIWYRQLATRLGMTLPEIRKLYENESPPKALPPKPASYSIGERHG